MVRMHRKYLTVLIVVFGSAFLTFLYIFKPLYYDETSVGYDENKAALTADEIQNQFINELVQRTDIEEFKKILKPILVERVVGTSNHERVKDYIAGEMRNLNWDVELDAFPDITPNKGELLFTNIIATNNPSASRFLVFACHYDSKMMNFTFIGATDSAVPCAMLIYFAKVLQRTLRNVQSPVGLKFIFFDGEEAFVAWSDKDSVYGARHLASLMESRSNLNQIELMVLLDLIGDSSPQFYSYFSNTHRWYRMLVSIEKLLGSKRLLLPETQPVRYFTNSKFFGADIKDDHEPFLVKGVPVLHIIPLPFPNVWHTEFDNESVINYNTVKNLLLIFEVFIVQYLTDPSLIAAV